MNTKQLKILSLGAVVVAFAGCASTEINPALENARAAVQQASNDPFVAEESAGTLERARDALTAAETTYQNEGNNEPELLEHQSYLARRYAETAMAMAAEARANEEVESAEAERKSVLLAIRTAQAERNAREAELARARATQAESQAEALADKVDELQTKQTDRGIVLTLSDVLFDVDKAQLKPGADRTIDQLAQFLKEYPQRELIIEGHTDSTGSDAYNDQLSERRADAVAMALERLGIPESRLETRGLGESQPVASNDTAAGRQQNRRVEVVVANL